MSSEHDEWVAKVFGLTVPSGTSQGQRGNHARPTLDIWREAKDVVDDQIGRIQGALRATEIDGALALADGGLGRITNNLQTRLIAALIDFDRSRGAEQAQTAAKVRSVLGPLANVVAKDPLLAVLEENPFGVAVSIRATLAAAFSEIEARL
ncbi:MAG: hypothetical protein JOZ05_12510 [Acetobacteraceae bacterium]|nr:hypothetical protein [Acetobacteraceae bacterium]